jgi:CRP-like cAMP-binding protein
MFVPMQDESRLQLRQHVEKIAPLTDSEFDYIFSFFTHKKLRKHQFLVQEGEPVTHEFFVLKGCLKAYLLDTTSKEHILQFAMEDWWITDFQAYFTQATATVQVDCIENTELLALSFQNREKLCTELHQIEHFFRLKLTSGFVALQQRVLSSLNQTVGERYEALLQRYPQLFQRVPKQHIAAYLGVSRETLSRLSHH